ncbi:glucosyl-3-phosphoglycerate synthase [Micromonospora sp. NPDC003197]
MAAKGDTRVSVVIPAHDEENTVGPIVATIRRHLVERLPLVDELIVVDSHSTDRTAAVAAAAGAEVVGQDKISRNLPRLDGKGGALWAGLAGSTGDVVAFVDADLREFRPHFVTGLLGPLLLDPSVAFVKGFYHRPLLGAESGPGSPGRDSYGPASPGRDMYGPDSVVRDAHRDGPGEHRVDVDPDGGGRVTELAARPLLNLFWPELAGFVQPLAGEYAGRRTVLERIPFVSDYGVEIAMLIDLLELVGLDALAQVDLGERLHRHQSTEALGRMSAQIMLTVWSRLHRQGRVTATGVPASVLTQFRRGAAAALPNLERDIVVSDVSVQERPPLIELRDRLTGCGRVSV